MFSVRRNFWLKIDEFRLQTEGTDFNSNKSMAESRTPTKQVYQFKILLNHERSIWRSILIDRDSTFKDLSCAIMAVLPPPTGARLWQFNGQDKQIKGHMKLDEVVTKIGQIITYRYAQGNHWLHILKFEAIHSADPNVQYPFCVAGDKDTPGKNPQRLRVGEIEWKPYFDVREF